MSRVQGKGSWAAGHRRPERPASVASTAYNSTVTSMSPSPKFNRPPPDADSARGTGRRGIPAAGGAATSKPAFSYGYRTPGEDEAPVRRGVKKGLSLDAGPSSRRGSRRSSRRASANSSHRGSGGPGALVGDVAQLEAEDPSVLRGSRQTFWSKLESNDLADGQEGLESNVQIAVRVRPLHPREEEEDHQDSLIGVYGKQIKLSSLSSGDEQLFAFDHIFDSQTTSTPPATQQSVFEVLGYQALALSWAGINTTIFAYGQTGSGKSFTMIGNPFQPGLVPRIADHLIYTMQRMRETQADRPGGGMSRAFLSCVEIYNEQLKDLLAPQPANSPRSALSESPNSPWRKPGSSVDVMHARHHHKGNGHHLPHHSSFPAMHAVGDLLFGHHNHPHPHHRNSLRISEKARRGIVVEGLSRHEMTSVDVTMDCVDMMMTNRATSRHRLNENSSRSHAVITLDIEQTIDESREKARHSRICLIDLAGSERSKSTGAKGVTLRESGAINRSLTVLGRVISALSRASDGKDRVHVPYRDSKLTLLLKDSLSGNTRTTMVANISPSDSSQEETLSTLRYAATCKKLKTRPVVEVDPTEVLIAQLRAELQELQKKLSSAGLAPPTPTSPSPVSVAESMRKTSSTAALFGNAEKEEEELRLRNEITKTELESLQEQLNKERERSEQLQKYIRQQQLRLADEMNKSKEVIDELQLVRSLLEENGIEMP